MVDMASLAEGLAIFKSGMDGIRAAFLMANEIKQSLPAGRAAEVGEALKRSEEQFAIAEAQIAKGLGFELCHCAYPPTPMLTVGRKHRLSTGPVHRCPKCGNTDNDGTGWTPTVEISARADAALTTTTS